MNRLPQFRSRLLLSLLPPVIDLLLPEILPLRAAGFCANHLPLIVQIGVEHANEVAKANVSEFDRFIDVNVKGTLLVMRHISAVMKLQDPRPISKGREARGSTRGAIVTMGSAQSFASTPGMVQYTTSKFAVLGLSKNAGE